MVRIKRGKTTRKKHKKILKMAKGYKGARSRRYKTAKEAVMKALSYQYRDRKAKKREIRRLWIVRLNAALRQYGIKYSDFIAKMKKANIKLDRKILSNLAIENEDVFKKIVDEVKKY